MHETLIEKMRELIERRRALGPEGHKKLVLSSLVLEGIYTRCHRIAPEYGGQPQKEEENPQ